MSKELSQPLELARLVTGILVEKKGIDVKLFNVEGQTSVTDFYVLATGRSGAHVISLCDDVADKISELGREPLRIEGKASNSWLLIDYGDVIVNVFDKQSREFYNFDRLMPESSLVSIQDIIDEIDKKYDINTAKE